MSVVMEQERQRSLDTSELEGKYLTFKLKQESYGIGIMTVQEIIGIMKVTRVPKAPPCIRGVVNLRGKVIPVVDLRSRFGMECQDDTERTCIIVLQVAAASGRLIMGIIVDEVSEVMDVRREQIEPPPSFGTALDTSFLLGMGKIGEKVIMLLDVDRILTTGDLGSGALQPL